MLMMLVSILRSHRWNRWNRWNRWIRWNRWSILNGHFSCIMVSVMFDSHRPKPCCNTAWISKCQIKIPLSLDSEQQPTATFGDPRDGPQVNGTRDSTKGDSEGHNDALWTQEGMERHKRGTCGSTEERSQRKRIRVQEFAKRIQIRAQRDPR